MKIAVTLVVPMELSRMCFWLGGGFVRAVLGAYDRWHSRSWM
jgi:hypothetical protein